MFKKKITVFTPTYNRAHTLPKLYKSLVEQTSQDFIWLIVDDGSTDYTKKIVEGWISENNIEIIYHFQSNQGKSVAHNKGVSLTKTELFTCVDSDDRLSEYAIEALLKTWEKYNRSTNIIGILAYKENIEGGPVVQSIDQKIVSTTLRDGYRRYGLKGDMFLIYRTENLKKYAFPKFEGEKFVPEAYLYDQLDQDGELVLLNEILYFYEYLDDGYTKKMTELLLNNPKGYLSFLNQRLLINNSMAEKVLDTIRYVAFCMAIEKKRIISDSVYPIISCITFPIGYLFYLFRYKGV